MSKRDYDPYTMQVKEIPELITELNSLIMKKLPGGKPIATIWGVLCGAARMHKESMPDPDDEVERTWSDFMNGRQAGQRYAAHVIIRKIADGMGVDNFKLREVPLGQPAVQGPEQGGHPGPGEADQPGGPGVVDGDVLAGRVPIDLPEHGPGRDEA